MTDIKVITQQLREAAKKATKGPWIVERKSFHNSGNLAGIYVDQQSGGCILECFANCLVTTDEQVRNNAAYVALVNPENIALILDALEAAQKWNVELEQQLESQPVLVVHETFETWFRDVEAGDDTNWKEPEYQSKEYMEYLSRMVLARGAWNACRAAMLSTSPAQQSVIPEGYKLVPIEPTEDMIIDGFESEPHEWFCSEGEWEEYEAMSGCQQAAHRAKLCWAAMIAVAPVPEGE